MPGAFRARDRARRKRRRAGGFEFPFAVCRAAPQRAPLVSRVPGSPRPGRQRCGHHGVLALFPRDVPQRLGRLVLPGVSIHAKSGGGGQVPEMRPRRGSVGVPRVRRRRVREVRAGVLAGPLERVRPLLRARADDAEGVGLREGRLRAPTDPVEDGPRRARPRRRRPGIARRHPERGWREGRRGIGDRRVSAAAEAAG